MLNHQDNLNKTKKKDKKIFLSIPLRLIHRLTEQIYRAEVIIKDTKKQKYIYLATKTHV